MTYIIEECKFCKKVIEGLTQGQVDSNMETHVRTQHKKEAEENGQKQGISS